MLVEQLWFFGNYMDALRCLSGINIMRDARSAAWLQDFECAFLAETDRNCRRLIQDDRVPTAPRFK